VAVKVSVRELVDNYERAGDINFRFSARSSAIAGIRGHQRVQKRRGEGYIAEKQVSDTVEGDRLQLSVSGRVDGYEPDIEPMLVEEIKTVRSDAEAIPETVRQSHRGQARVYAYLLAVAEARDEVLVRLVYLQLDDDSEVWDEELLSLTELRAYYHSLTRSYIAWLEKLDDWQAVRDTSVSSLPFPYTDYRAGQRDMAVSVYRALAAGKSLVMQAATGIGKTMGTLYPAIKALRECDFDKVFFLTAKNSGVDAAQRAVADLRRSGLKLRDVTLTAKDKICFTPGAPCHPDHCEYARGYYDRIGQVVSTLAGKDCALDREAIERIAVSEGLCPFELSLDLSTIADVVICDYNYVFDPAVYLRRYFEDSDGKYAFLVDEAHNLADRGRDIFSASLDKDAILSLRRDLLGVLPGLAKRLARINAELLTIRRPHKEAFDTQGHLVLEDFPEGVVRALRNFCSDAEQVLARNESAGWQELLLQLYFDALRFIRTSELFDENYVCLLEKNGRATRLRIVNLNPYSGLSAAMSRGASSICFSATMRPQRYFEQLIGVPDDAPWYGVASPFDPGHLGVFSAPFISTAFRDRADSIYELVDLIHDVTSQKQGNYLVFLPSHAYLSDVFEKFVERYPGLLAIRQTTGMSGETRQAFLDAFEDTDRDTTLVGFAVMGGIFGEGIDLTGARLIGVVIAGVGLPQLCIERDLIRNYFEGHQGDGQGFRFAYEYPGINRVLQTAGRVIRTESDKGIICLVDRRYSEIRYRELLPGDWRVQETRSRQDLGEAVDAFWQSVDHD
jgi:DNA excision repair protein ERCC-2